MWSKRVIGLLIVLAAAFAAGCSAESGVVDDGSNNDATDLNNNNDNNNTCPADRQCGSYCCSEDEDCVDGMCLPHCDHERCGTDCCTDEEECVYGECLPKCETVRCGENLHDCCAEGEICLDGVQCVPDCGDRLLLCGENLDMCCQPGQVCLDSQCVTPGSECTNLFDCDEGWYCEETIGKCLPLPPNAEQCQGQPSFTEIQPVLEWYWPGVNYNGRDYNDILAAPSVGDVNGDGIPDVVVSLYGSASGNPNIIAVLSGAGDGQGGPRLLFTIPSSQAPSLPEVFWGITPALGNFDSDPALEIVYLSRDGQVVIVDNDGINTVCDRNSFPSCSGIRDLGSSYTRFGGGPSLVDVNHDGVPDVVVGRYVLDGRNISDPNMDIAVLPYATSEPIVADVDGDGHYEFIDPRFSRDLETGQDEWTADRSGWDSIGNTTFQAIGDLFPSVQGPEVVFIHNHVYIYSALTGQTLVGPSGSLLDTSVSIPGGGHGGPPTIADFDGDGYPEVSTAGLRAYVVYDPDCTDPPIRQGQCSSGRTDFILWESPTQDLSSSETGSSVFDFQGDGKAEVLYNDECFLHIYQGDTGEELVTPVLPNSSRTYAEYPLVADVDGDGNAEIVVIGNNDQAVSRDHCPESWHRANIDIDEFCSLFDCQDVGACTTTGTGDATCTDDRAVCDSNGRCQIPLGTQGVRVFGDYYDRWVRTRPIWNEFSYHVTNVEYDYNHGGWVVPQLEQPSWSTYNNFRQNVQGGVVFPVPDLRVSVRTAVECPDVVHIVATVYNEGSAGVPPGVRVHFFMAKDGEPAQEIGMQQTQTTILPGGWERLSMTYQGQLELHVEYRFFATVNGDMSVEECDYSDSTSMDATAQCDRVVQ